MKRLLAMAALLLASSAAEAQYQFEYGGRTIRIDPDRGTVSIPGVYDNTRKAKRSHDQDSVRSRPSTQDAKTDPKSDPKTDPQSAPPSASTDTAAVPPPAAPAPSAEPAPATATTAPATAAPATAADQSATTATANNTPADTTAVQPPPAPPAPAPLPPLQQSATPAAAAPAPPPPPAPTVAAAPPATPAPAAQAQRRDPNSPVGVWLTEEKEGKVRIEQCGANLCGYSVDAKSNANGEQVLINMKPGKDQKWSGRILDPNTGSTYDSTLAMRGPDTLRVQGCAFGGMFCGGQTWTRVN
jgi:uncharacterized protein (DUF2147 family)